MFNKLVLCKKYFIIENQYYFNIIVTYFAISNNISMNKAKMNMLGLH